MEQTSFELVRCSVCGAANRVPRQRLDLQPRCGKCRAALFSAGRPAAAPRPGRVLRCSHCGSKNRIAADRGGATARCGKCSQPLDLAALSAPQPINVNDLNFDDKVLHSPLPVLLFAWAPWCSTCTVVAPQIDRLAAQMTGQIRVCKANVGAYPNLGARLNVLSVPHLFIYDRGRQLESLPGTLDHKDLYSKMMSYVY